MRNGIKNEELIIQVSIHSYFIGMCKNMWRSQLRKRQLFAYSDWVLDRLEDPQAIVIETMTLQDQQTLYQKYYSKLHPSHTAVLQEFFDGKNTREVANALGYTEGYTRKKKHLIKKQLLAMITKDPIYNELMA